MHVSIQPQQIADDCVAVEVTWLANESVHEEIGEGDDLEHAIGQAIGADEGQVAFGSARDDLAAAICLRNGRAFTATIEGNTIVCVR